MTAADVHTAYPPEAIHQNELSYLSVHLSSSPFSRVAYYYDEETERQTITHIFFMLRRSYNDEENDEIDAVTLRTKLTESVGRPFVVTPRHYMWLPSGNTNVFVSDDTGHVIMTENFRPIGWPHAKETTALCKALSENECPAPPA